MSMANLHPNANTGSFLPDVRETMLVDATMELNGLINHVVSTFFTDSELGEERNFMLRGVLIRVQALANAMYATACSPDDELRHHLGAAYGKHHSFINTPASESSSSHSGEEA